MHLQVRGAIAERLLAILLRPETDVAELLQGLSCVSHLLLVLYRQHKTAFMTGQLYHDTQAMIRSIFYCVLQAQKHCPNQPMFLWQIGTDGLENVFALARTLTHSSNFNLKELCDRLGAAVALEDIYAAHPDWKRISKRLSGSLDHMNVRSWLERGSEQNCNIRTVDVKASWAEGRHDAVDLLSCHRDFQDVTMETFVGMVDANITMFKPFG